MLRGKSEPTITRSLSAYDGVTKQTIGSNAAWFRYNFDGYGQTSAGGPYNNSSSGKDLPAGVALRLLKDDKVAITIRTDRATTGSDRNSDSSAV